MGWRLGHPQFRHPKATTHRSLLGQSVTVAQARGEIHQPDELGAIPFVIIQLIMVGLLIFFPQMSLVYKSGLPEGDVNKVKIEIPSDEPSAEKSDDLMKDLQKDLGAPQPVPGKEPGK